MGTKGAASNALGDMNGPWLEAAHRSLKGASVEDLASPTLEGVTVQPLYASGSAPDRTSALVRSVGDGGWDIRAEVAAPDPQTANSLALEALSGGCTSLLLRIDDGAIASGQDLSRALDGVVIEAAPIALDAGFLGAEAASWLAEIAKDAPAARLGFHLDPLGAFAEAGESPGAIEAHVRRAAALAAELSEPYPRATMFLASGRAAHEAGGSAVQELGVMAAAALAYARALVGAGLSVSSAFERVALGLSADGDYLISIAKLRAAREIWDRAAVACGAAAPARIEVRSSARMLTAADPWTNLLRLTVAGFAGAAGGADAMVLGAYTDALGQPAGRARRLARNTQLILLQESGLGHVEDPAAGAFAFEALTDGLAREGWRFFQAIESKGGLAAALMSGFIADAVAGVARARDLAVAEDRTPVLGVTRFPDPTPVTVETDGAWLDRCVAVPSTARLEGSDSRCPPLAPMRIAATAEGIAKDLQP